MDPNDAFSAPHPFRWDLGPPAHAAAPPSPFPLAPSRELEDLVAGYGVRPSTVARISELGFTASTLLGRTERELDDTMAALAGLFRWDVLLGERFGLRAARRAERGRVQFQTGSTALDATSQEGTTCTACHPSRALRLCMSAECSACSFLRFVNLLYMIVRA
jgi:hypothetical protein